MNSNDAKLGALVRLKFSNQFKTIKLGIIVDSKKDSFMVKWICYNKQECLRCLEIISDGL